MFQTIGALSARRSKPVYRRENGELYIKLNENFHVKVKLDESKESWLGDGKAEELDPSEIVEVVQPSDGT